MKIKPARLAGKLLCSLALLFALLAPAYAAKPVDDNYLSDSIRQKLAADEVVKGGAIDVQVNQGAVILKGRVDEEKQKSRAEKIAKKVSGVKSVSNQIVIGKPDLRQ